MRRIERFFRRQLRARETREVPIPRGPSPQELDQRACEARLAHFPPEDSAMLRADLHASAAREPGPS